MDLYDYLYTDLRKLAHARNDSIRRFQGYQEDDTETLRRLVAGDLDAKALGEIASLAVAMSARRSHLLELSLGAAEINHLLSLSDVTAIIDDIWGTES